MKLVSSLNNLLFKMHVIFQKCADFKIEQNMGGFRSRLCHCSETLSPSILCWLRWLSGAEWRIKALYFIIYNEGGQIWKDQLIESSFSIPERKSVYLFSTCFPSQFFLVVFSLDVDYNKKSCRNFYTAHCLIYRNWTSFFQYRS